MGDPAGEADRGALRLDFDRRLMLQFRGAAITSDAGLLAYRELDDTVGLTNTSDEHAIWPIRRFEKQLREGSLYSTPGPGGLAFARRRRMCPFMCSQTASQPRPAWRYESCFVNDLSREISYVRDPRFLSRRTFSLADAQVPHRCLGTEERCSAISHGSRCCPHDRAPAASWTGKH